LIKYILIDSGGEIFWCDLGGNVYVVDCKYLELFKNIITKNI